MCGIVRIHRFSSPGIFFPPKFLTLSTICALALSKRVCVNFTVGTMRFVSDINGVKHSIHRCICVFIGDEYVVLRKHWTSSISEKLS